MTRGNFQRVFSDVFVKCRVMDFDDLVHSRRMTAPEMSSAGAFAQDVLREIRLRKSAASSGKSHWLDVFDGFLKPAILAAGLAVALTVGAVTPYLVHPLLLQPSVAMTDMEIFTGSSRSLPSVRLAEIP